MTGISEARQVCRNRITTPTTSNTATKIVTTTSRTDFATKIVGSLDDDRVDTRWERLFQLGHGRQHFVLDRQRICPGLRKDQQRQSVAAVHVGGGAVIGGANLDAADIADARDAAAIVGLDDDVGELLRRRQAAQRLYIY